MVAVADSELDLGASAAAIRRYGRALRLGEGAATSWRVDVTSRLGDAYRRRGRYREASAVLHTAVALAGRSAENRTALGGVLNDLGVLCKYSGRFAEGARVFAERCASPRRSTGPTTRGWPRCCTTSAGWSTRAVASPRPSRGRAGGSRSARRRSGADHVDVAEDRAALGGILDGLGRYDESMPLYAQALAVVERARGPGHPEVAVILHNMGAVHAERGQFKEAEALLRRAFGIEQKALGKRHPDVGAQPSTTSAWCWAAPGALPEGARRCRRALRRSSPRCSLRAIRAAAPPRPPCAPSGAADPSAEQGLVGVGVPVPPRGPCCGS